MLANGTFSYHWILKWLRRNSELGTSWMASCTLYSVLSLPSNDPWWSRFNSLSVTSYEFNFLPVLSEIQAKLKVNCRIKYPSRLRDLYNKEGFICLYCITDLITLQLYSFTLDFHAFVVHAIYIYKTFILYPLKLLRNTGCYMMYSGITKIYYRKTVGHVFTKPVQIEETTQKFGETGCLCKQKSNGRPLIFWCRNYFI